MPLTKLTYETGPATFIQFAVLGLLNIATGVQSVVLTCQKDNNDCLGNLLVSFIFYLLILGWFGAITALGFIAQHRRSQRLAWLLIFAELAIAGVASLNIKLNLKYDNGWLTLITSIIDFVLAFWIITLAWRLSKASGGRVVAKQKQRARKRRPSS
jgi:cell division protein FtsB